MTSIRARFCASGFNFPISSNAASAAGKLRCALIGVAQLLVKNRQRAGIPFAARLALDTRDGIGQHLHRFVVVALVLIEKRFVVENFQAARRELLGARQTRFGLIELSQPSVKLRGPQEIFRRARLQLRKLGELLERFRVFILRKAAPAPIRGDGPDRPGSPATAWR